LNDQPGGVPAVPPAFPAAVPPAAVPPVVVPPLVVDPPPVVVPLTHLQRSGFQTYPGAQLTGLGQTHSQRVESQTRWRGHIF